MSVYKIITSAEMLRKQNLFMCHSKRTDGVKWSGRKFEMREEKKASFPTERIIKWNSLWKDTMEPKRVSDLKMDWMNP